MNAISKKTARMFRAAAPMLLLAVLAQKPAQAAPEVSYTVTVKDTSHALLHVAMTIQEPAEEKIAVAIPAWAPGYYKIAHYETDISAMTATDAAGKALVVAHPNPRVWETDRPAASGSVKFEYDFHANDPGYGFFGSKVTAGGGYINGPSAFLYYVGHTDVDTHLTLEVKGAKQAATVLNSVGANVGKTSAFMYHADSYDELVDTPIQFGNFREIDFNVDTTPFRVVIVGNWNYDKAKVTDTLTKIAKSAKAVFGSFPFDKYLFIYHVGGAGFEGGLEHRASTVIHLARTSSGTPDDDFVQISAHEFFHAWNVKRLHPAALAPLEYSKESRTASLWFAEGVTDYYAYLLPVRAGIRSPDWFLKQIADTLNMLEDTPARRSESLEDASRRVWEEDAFSLDGLSYYVKGALAGLYFDLRIREIRKNAASLDDVMRELDINYGKPNVGYPEAALLNTLDVVGRADFTDEYNRYVRGVEEFNWDAVLAGAGIAMQREKIASLGVATEGSKDPATEFAPVVKKVYGGMTGEAIGLKVGDMVQNVNGVAVTQSNFVGSVRKLHPGETVAMDVLRGGKIVSLHGEMGYRWKITKLSLVPETELAPPALELRRGFFRATEAR